MGCIGIFIFVVCLNFVVVGGVIVLNVILYNIGEIYCLDVWIGDIVSVYCSGDVGVIIYLNVLSRI